VSKAIAGVSIAGLLLAVLGWFVLFAGLRNSSDGRLEMAETALQQTAASIAEANALISPTGAAEQADLLAFMGEVEAALVDSDFLPESGSGIEELSVEEARARYRPVPLIDLVDEFDAQILSLAASPFEPGNAEGLTVSRGSASMAVPHAAAAVNLTAALDGLSDVIVDEMQVCGGDDDEEEAVDYVRMDLAFRWFGRSTETVQLDIGEEETTE